MMRLKKLFHNPWLLLAYILKKIARIVPDKIQLSLLHKVYVGKLVDWDNPKTFTEKLQWLKLYNRRPEYTTMVDKYAVKDYVANIIGEEYIIPTLGVWNSAEEIDWDSLPKRFVLKTTHGGGSNGVWICKDKSKFDKHKCIKEIRASLRSDLYWLFREWPYKNVPKRIIAEEFIMESSLQISDDNFDDLRDYKFFCFNGKVEVFKIDFNRQIYHQANYYTRDGELLPFGEVVCPPDLNKEMDFPENIGSMIELAERLSQDLPFARVDFYNVNGIVYFGEITFFPASGYGTFTSEDFNIMLGETLKLSKFCLSE